MYEEPFIKYEVVLVNDMVVKYHNYVGLKDDPTTIFIENKPDDVPWCASFVSWVLNRSNIKNPKSAGSQIYLNHTTLKKIKKPLFGAIAVFSNYKKDGTYLRQGHVSFLYGKENNGDFICLGGNQGNKLKFSTYKKINKYKKFEQRLKGFYIPVNYNEKSLSVIEEHNINELNKLLKVGKTKKNESTR